MYKKYISIFSFIILLMLIYSNVFAHSGRTDELGGHKDNKNVSGFGNYHYHCGGNPPHLHTNGLCPYSPNTVVTKTNNTQSVQNKSASTAAINIPVDNIYFKESQCTIEIGKQIKPSYVIEPNNATDKTVKFSTSNSDVLEINENGAINGKNVGTAKYIVTANNGKSANLTVTIIRYPESIKINNIQKEEFLVGDEINLKCIVLPEDASSNVSWTSSNNSIATVDYTGKVTCISKGNVTIKAQDKNGKSDSIELKISQKEDSTNSIIPIFFVLIGIGAIIPFVLRKIDKKEGIITNI